MPLKKKGSQVRVVCPRCHSYKDNRLVPTERGYDRQLKHFVCDHCEIGWYEPSGARSKPVIGDIESARKSYVREGRPSK